MEAFKGKKVKSIYFEDMKVVITFYETNEQLVVQSESYPHTGVDAGIVKFVQKD